MIRKLTLALLLTLPTIAVAIDLEGYYITAKGGASKTFNTGTTNFVDDTGGLFSSENEDLGTGTAFGFSVGKYLTNSFRLELEAIKRTGYELMLVFLNFLSSLKKQRFKQKLYLLMAFMTSNLLP